MSGLPWYKCYPRDFNDGMVGLTMEERGAYVTILNLIYAKGVPVEDDPGFFVALLNCSGRAWAKVRAGLIAKKKLFEVSFNGFPSLMNRRAADEISIAEEKSEKFSEGGRRGGRKSQSKSRENSDLSQARLEPGSSDTDTDTDTERTTTTTMCASDWKRMLAEAAEAAGDMADLTSPSMLHAGDLRQLVEPTSGEPCDWAEVLDAIRMTASRQRAKRKPIRSWSWVHQDAWALRDKRLNAPAPEASVVVPIRATGPPSLTDRITAENAEARRLTLEKLKIQDG